jgi:hypothetical protein
MQLSALPETLESLERSAVAEFHANIIGLAATS